MHICRSWHPRKRSIYQGAEPSSVELEVARFLRLTTFVGLRKDPQQSWKLRFWVFYFKNFLGPCPQTPLGSLRLQRSQGALRRQQNFTSAAFRNISATLENCRKPCWPSFFMWIRVRTGIERPMLSRKRMKPHFQQTKGNLGADLAAHQARVPYNVVVKRKLACSGELWALVRVVICRPAQNPKQPLKGLRQAICYLFIKLKRFFASVEFQKTIFRLWTVSCCLL